MLSGDKYIFFYVNFGSGFIAVFAFLPQVKYKENYMSQLGIWRSIPDHPENFHHRAVTDAVSDVSLEIFYFYI